MLPFTANDELIVCYCEKEMRESVLLVYFQNPFMSRSFTNAAVRFENSSDQI